MFGCLLRKIGCLVIILAAVAGYYWYTHRSDRSTPPPAVAAQWLLVTEADASAGEKAVVGLKSGSGRAYASLTAPQAVGYLIQGLAGYFPQSAENMQAMITGDTLHVKAVVSIKDFGGAQILGPLASVLGARDTVVLAGRVSIVSPGLAQLRIVDAKIHDLRIPHAAVPKLMAQLRRKTFDGVANDALPLPLPSHIAEIRIANGKVTLYKNI